jgi:hypothetical protein
MARDEYGNAVRLPDWPASVKRAVPRGPGRCTPLHGCHAPGRTCRHAGPGRNAVLADPVRQRRTIHPHAPRRRRVEERRMQIHMGVSSVGQSPVPGGAQRKLSHQRIVGGRDRQGGASGEGLPRGGAEPEWTLESAPRRLDGPARRRGGVGAHRDPARSPHDHGPVAAAARGRAKSAVYQGLRELQAAGVLPPLSQARRNQSWEAVGLLDLLAGLEAGEQPARAAE